MALHWRAPVGFAIVLGIGTPAHADEAAPSPKPVPILGGDLVEPCGFPTTVSVGGFCTGTLVHPRLVVYAAHCGDEVPWIRLTDKIEDSPNIEVVPEMCATHPIGQYGFGTDAAFCRLAAPIEGIPIIPPLMGCEAEEALQIGQAVTVVGFGISDDETESYGIKRKLNTQINALSWDEVFVGGIDEGVCYGDSGGPTYVQLADGSWRSFGITSWGQPGCGFGGYLSTIGHNIEWIEQAAELDITPCHDGLGGWDRGPDCGGFDTEPHAEGGDWAVGCEFGPLGGYESTCGAAFDPDLVDASAPTLTIVEPVAYSRIDPAEGAETVKVPVAVVIDDADGWGVGEIELVILQGNTEYARVSDPAAPFAFSNLAFPIGVWTLRAEAIDRAGNPGVSDPVVFGVGEDPPEPPPPEPEPSDDSGTSDGPIDPASTGVASDGNDGSDVTGDGDPDAIVGDDGCGCRTHDSNRDAPRWLVLAIFGLLMRRRRAALCSGALAIACGDDPVASASTDTDVATSTDATGALPDPSSSDGSDPDDTVADPPPDLPLPIAPGCGNGILEDDEICDDGNRTDGDGCSATCEPSGELLAQTQWPDRGSAGGSDIARAPDGTYVATGWAADAGAPPSAAIVGLSADLRPAWSTLAPGAAPDDLVFARAVAIDPAGTIYAAGVTYRDEAGREVSEPWLARFDPDGAMVWSVAMPSPYSEAAYDEIAVLPGGDPVAVGSVLTDDGTWRAVVRRHAAADASPVWTKQHALEDPASAALTLSVTADDDLLVAGWIAATAGRDLWLGRFDADGAPIDTTVFGEPITFYYPRSVTMTADGDAVVCGGVVRASAANAMFGRFTLGTDAPAVWLRRIESQGAGTSWCEGMVLDHDERVAFAGYSFHADQSFDYLVGRLAADGEILWSSLVSPTRGFFQDFGEGLVLDDAGDLVVVGSSQIAGTGRMWIGSIRG